MATDSPRYFIAIPFDDIVRQRLVAIQPPPVDGMRLIERDEFHLTLHFLGSMSPDSVEAAVQTLAELKETSFAIAIKGVGHFEFNGKPNVLWAGVDGGPALLQLRHEIGKRLANSIDFEVEERPYSPHITLARLPESLPNGFIESFVEETSTFEIPLVFVERVCLFSSQFVDGAPKYTMEVSFLLAKGDDASAYPDGVPDPHLFGFIPLGVACGRSAEDADEAICRVSQAIQQPIRYTDSQFYLHDITAGAIHPNKSWVAWVENTYKKLSDHVDTDFWLKIRDENGKTSEWTIETYNPFFGCRVGYMAWHNDRIVLIYREKHDTYVCSRDLNGGKFQEAIADEWLVADNQVYFRSDKPDLVERFKLPELQRLEPISADEARAMEVLPLDYDRANESWKNIKEQSAQFFPQRSDGLFAKVYRWMMLEWFS